MKTINDIPTEIALKMNKKEGIEEIIKNYDNHCFFGKNADVKIKNNILVCNTFNEHGAYITSYYNNKGQRYYSGHEYPVFGRYTEFDKVDRVIQFKNDHWLTVNVYEDDTRLYFNFERLYNIVSVRGFVIKKNNIKELWSVLKRLAVQIDYVSETYLDLLVNNLDEMGYVSDDDRMLISLLNNYFSNTGECKKKFVLKLEQTMTKKFELGSKYDNETFLLAVEWTSSLVDLLDQMVCNYSESNQTHEKNIQMARNVYAKLYYDQRLTTNDELDKVNDLFKEFGMKTLERLRTVDKKTWIEPVFEKENEPLAYTAKYISTFGLEAELDFDYSYVGKVEFGDFHNSIVPRLPKVTFDVNTNERRGLIYLIEYFMSENIRIYNEIPTEGVKGEIEKCKLYSKPFKRSKVKAEMLRFALEMLENERTDYIGRTLCLNIIGKLTHGLDLNKWETKFALNPDLFSCGPYGLEQLFETENVEEILEIIL